MQEINKCLLCSGKIKLFETIKVREYFQCSNCLSIMMHPKHYLSKEKEKAHYKTHDNNVLDKRYQNFVSPIVNSVKKNFKPYHLGLDFGAGTGPVITSMLNKKDYNLKLYDPYFHNKPKNLLKNYDYIVCCEVMEHFYDPYKEFKLMSDILNPKGSIFCMTSIYDEDINFKDWYYKNDFTHVFFYHKKAIKWIKEEFGFSEYYIDDKLVKLIKKV